MDKYNVGVHESDNYNGGEEYCGSEFYFTIDGEIMRDQTIDEIIDDLKNKE